MNQEFIKAFTDLMSGALGQNLNLDNPGLTYQETKKTDGNSVGTFVLNTTGLTLKPGQMGGLRQAFRDSKFKVMSRGTEFKVTLPADKDSIETLKKLRKQIMAKS